MGSGTANPHDENVKGVRTFAEYIASSHDVGFTLGGEPEVDLFGFSDAMYLTKGYSLSRLAYCFFLNLTSGCICARSLKDSKVSHSSTEAKLKALDEAIRQAVWLRNFFAELSYPQSKPTVIYVDSKSSIAISESLKTGSNVGHIMMRINYIYQEVLTKTVEIKYIHISNQAVNARAIRCP
jgi:hypothetical protein